MEARPWRLEDPLGKADEPEFVSKPEEFVSKPDMVESPRVPKVV